MAPSQGSYLSALDSGSSAQNRFVLISSAPSPSKKSSHLMGWGGFRRQLVRASVLWLVGFKEACQLQKAIPFCKRSRPVLVKTGQCFLLNGCLFLGSIMFLQRVVIPILRCFLGRPLQLSPEIGLVSDRDSRSASVLQNVIVGVCYVFWLYPLYLVSFVVNIIWYNDIARYAFQVMGKSEVNSQKTPVEFQSPNAGQGTCATEGRPINQNDSGLRRAMLQIGEQIYSVIMVSVFFLEVFAVTFVPYLGPLLNFVLLSWLYAYYCFDYKWGFSRWSLERRLFFFETNWAFFAGFGSPCVFATFFFSPFISAGVMNVLFPMFVLVATACNPEEVVQKCIGSHHLIGTGWRLPIFYVANNLMIPLLGLLRPGETHAPSSIQSRKRAE